MRSQWMQNFAPICLVQWLPVIEDADLGNSGYREYIKTIATASENHAASGRMYSTGAYRHVVASDEFQQTFIAGETDQFIAWGSSYANDGVFTSAPPTGLSWSNGDKFILSYLNQNFVVSPKPAAMSYGVVYYMVNVTGTTFQLSETLGGTPITGIGAGTAQHGISLASFDAQLGVEVANVSADSYFGIARAATVACYLAGEVSQDTYNIYEAYMSPINTNEYGPWNYSGEQS
jgi:hypothetical protein